jgi:hypothetical protein
LIAALALFACDKADREPIPSDADVDRLENELKAEPCIGPLAGWERRYRYSSDTGGVVSQNQIQFNLRQAGAFEIRAGREITPPHPADEHDIDETPVKMASGIFDRSQGKLYVAFCGLNTGG